LGQFKSGERAVHHDKSAAVAVGQGVYADQRLDALLSIAGRMDGFQYRCRNDPSYTMLYISDVLTVSGFPPSDFIHNEARNNVSVIHPDDLAAVYSAVDTALAMRRNWRMLTIASCRFSANLCGHARSVAACSMKPTN
jgi:hypothetical protein